MHLLLIAASSLAFATAAQAQDAPAPADEPVEVAEEKPDAVAEMEFLKAQVEALQAQVSELSKATKAASPTWKGAPQWVDTAGWSFKPKGVIQFDAGYVSLPRKIAGTVPVAGTSAGSGVNTNNLGWGNRARRLIFGAEGSIPGGFGYKLELELSQGGVNYEDMVISYQKPGSPWSITVGHQYPLSSLELLTSNRFTTFMERAGNTDAFGYGRRLGTTIAYTDPAGLWALSGGVYSEDVANANVARTGWQASVRGWYAPMVGDVQTHLGFQFQHRSQPKDAQNVRYRQRPYTQVTDQRFLDTGAIAAKGDDILGGELAAIYKSFHFASEYQMVWVRSIALGTPLGINNATGTTNFAADDPKFRSGYVEVGYYLTGETRGYKGGKWDRTKVLHPVTDGGWGAWQINARADFTDLTDRVGGPATIFVPPAAPAANVPLTYINGGVTKGYEASLIWLPMDYVKLMLQYAHSDISGGPSARAFSGYTTPSPAGFRHKYGVDAVTLRSQLDF